MTFVMMSSNDDKVTFVSFFIKTYSIFPIQYMYKMSCKMYKHFLRYSIFFHTSVTKNFKNVNTWLSWWRHQMMRKITFVNFFIKTYSILPIQYMYKISCKMYKYFLRYSMFFHTSITKILTRKCFQKQSFTKFLRLTLVFMWNSPLREKLNFCFSIVFCWYWRNFHFDMKTEQ